MMPRRNAPETCACNPELSSTSVQSFGPDYRPGLFLVERNRHTSIPTVISCAAICRASWSGEQALPLPGRGIAHEPAGQVVARDHVRFLFDQQCDVRVLLE